MRNHFRISRSISFGICVGMGWSSICWGLIHAYSRKSPAPLTPFFRSAPGAHCKIEIVRLHAAPVFGRSSGKYPVPFVRTARITSKVRSSSLVSIPRVARNDGVSELIIQNKAFMGNDNKGTIHAGRPINGIGSHQCARQFSDSLLAANLIIRRRILEPPNLYFETRAGESFSLLSTRTLYF